MSWDWNITNTFPMQMTDKKTLTVHSLCCFVDRLRILTPLAGAVLQNDPSHIDCTLLAEKKQLLKFIVKHQQKLIQNPLYML